jgi:Predicted transcriptional regulators
LKGGGGLIQINCNDARPIYEKVKESLRRLILSGALPEDERLPSVRELAVSLTVNPNTIQRAYRELEQEGYIVSVPGKGSFVAHGGGARAARVAELKEKLFTLAGEFETVGVTRAEMADMLKEEES